jgi:hypothetical protein
MTDTMTSQNIDLSSFPRTKLDSHPQSGGSSIGRRMDCVVIFCRVSQFLKANSKILPPIRRRPLVSALFFYPWFEIHQIPRLQFDPLTVSLNKPYTSKYK